MAFGLELWRHLPVCQAVGDEALQLLSENLGRTGCLNGRFALPLEWPRQSPANTAQQTREGAVVC